MKFNFTDTFPETLSLPSNKVTFSISGLLAIISYSISIFGLNSLDIYKKIIICLSVTSIILLIDVIILFIRERELYFYSCFLKQYYDDINIRLGNTEQKLKDLNSRLNDVTHK